MKFTKMHGIGNDYVYVNCFQERVENPAAVSRFVSDRHFGIGSDGLILIKPSQRADCEMDIYNLDGSRAKMCGNGIRCVAKYAYDHGIVHETEITVDTASGLRTLQLTVADGRVQKVRVNMGSAILEPEQIPVAAPLTGKPPVTGALLSVKGATWAVTPVSMGNPHAVVFVPDVDALDLKEIGPAFEFHPAFPDRVNTEFVQVLDDGHVKMRVWERGSGETMACGTGACAVAVASILNEKVRGDQPLTVSLRGGDLEIEWNREENIVYMTGPATEVFSGEILLPPGVR